MLTGESVNPRWPASRQVSLNFQFQLTGVYGHEFKAKLTLSFLQSLGGQLGKVCGLSQRMLVLPGN